MRNIAPRTIDIFIEHQAAPVGDGHGMNEPGPRGRGIDVDDALNGARECGLVHAEIAGARGAPAVASGFRLTIHVRRLAAWTRGETCGVLLVRAREGNAAAA